MPDRIQWQNGVVKFLVPKKNCGFIDRIEPSGENQIAHRWYFSYADFIGDIRKLEIGSSVTFCTDIFAPIVGGKSPVAKSVQLQK